ncbi:MAG: phosphate acyltransferase, partial [Parvularculaceae bacterium]
MASAEKVTISVDAMGADGGLEATLGGCIQALKEGVAANLLLHGQEAEIKPVLQRLGGAEFAERLEIRHADRVVTMEDKPTQVMRRGKDTSMWGAIASVKNGDAQAAISCGNTGALMAVSMLQLRMIEGVSRPAITAGWPTMTGRSVVLDVGANVEATAEQLVQFAIMGEAYYRA